MKYVKKIINMTWIIDMIITYIHETILITIVCNLPMSLCPFIKTNKINNEKYMSINGTKIGTWPKSKKF